MTTSKTMATARRMTTLTTIAMVRRTVAIVWTRVAAAQQKVMQSVGTYQQATRQPAGEQDATGGEAPGGKRRQGLNRPRLRVERRRQSQEDERRRRWFTNEEWESLVALKEANAANLSNTAVADATNNVDGGLLMENKMIGGESGTVFLNCSSRNF
jgi:hypothetical protein